MMGISAIVATYNRKDELRRLCRSIVENNYPQFELIIVDQNRDDLLNEVVEEFSSYFPIIHLKQTEPNQSKARNYGALHASYPVICFPDDDCWFDGEALQKVDAQFSSLPATDLLVINWRQNPHRHTTSGALKKRDIYSFRSVGYVTYVLFFRTAAFHRLGGFLENIGIGMYIGGGEDSELTFRAAEKGLNIYYDAEIGVNHKYIPIISRDYPVIKARQRAMGMVFARFDLPFFIILRGLLSPILRMMTFNKKKRLEYYHVFIGRWQGFIYTLLNKKQLGTPNVQTRLAA